MKFKTPSKPVVKLAYYANNQLSENSQNTVDHVFTVPDDGRFFTGDFLKREEKIHRPCALITSCHRFFTTFSFENIEKTPVSNSLYLLLENKQTDRPVTNQTIKS